MSAKNCRTHFSFLLLVFLALSVPLASNATECDTKIDWNVLAEKMLTSAANIAAHDRVVLLYDTQKNPELIASLRQSVAKHQAVLVAEWPRPNEAILNQRRQLPAEQWAGQRANEDKAFLQVLAGADILLWLDSGNILDGVKRWERLLSQSKNLRSVHAHWFLPPNAHERCFVETSYWRASHVDPKKLELIQKRFAETLLNADSIQLTSPSGTSLTIAFAEGARFGINSGKQHRYAHVYADSTRAKEEEFPASAIRTTQLHLDGTLVAKSMLRDESIQIRFEIRKNRIQQILAPDNLRKELEDKLKVVNGDHIAEFIIGLNSELEKLTPSGWPLYFGSGGGMVQIRIGDNWESGGNNRAPDHWQDIYALPDATLVADGKILIKDGEILVD
jgi:hypothetical protein